MLTTPVYGIRYAESNDSNEIWPKFEAIADDVETMSTQYFGVIKRWRRETPRTSTGGVETGILRIDNIPRSLWYTPQHTTSLALGLVGLVVASAAGARASLAAIGGAGLARGLATAPDGDLKTALATLGRAVLRSRRPG